MIGSGDYISRKAAIEAMYKDAEANPNHTFWTSQFEALMDIPAADVRPVVSGRWNIVKLPPDPGYKAKECSTCKCNFWDLEEWNFCPNCGADMREES